MIKYYSEFILMLNQATTDRAELAKLLNISDLQLSYITNVDAGHGLESHYKEMAKLILEYFRT